MRAWALIRIRSRADQQPATWADVRIPRDARAVFGRVPVDPASAAIAGRQLLHSADGARTAAAAAAHSPGTELPQGVVLTRCAAVLPAVQGFLAPSNNFKPLPTMRV